ncbi:MAG: redoxin domain-containing protein [Ferruginibacter sp.]
MVVSSIKTGALMIAWLVLSLCVAGQKQAQTVPGFRFFKLDKTAFTNKNLETNKLLFFVFFDVSCDHCRHAMQNINQHIGEFKNTAIYLITLDDEAGIKNFMSHFGQNLPGNKQVTILRDPQNEFINKFRPVKYPAMFLYSKSKKLIRYDDEPDHLADFLKQIKSAVK